jgi:hypothetical protein
MLVTPDFVFVHMPKTGGSFVVRMLRSIYGAAAVETGRKHATCEEIPVSERGKPIVSVARSPWDRYISQYHYGWWKTHPQEYCDPAPILAAHPSYPDVDFRSFVSIANRYFVNAHRGTSSGFDNARYAGEDALGWHTEQFVRFYCNNPREAFASIGPETLATGHIPDFEFPVRFLRTESLNRDLDALLGEYGMGDEARAQVRVHAPVLPDDAFEPREIRPTEDYYDLDLRTWLLRREAFLFARFPDYRETLA